MILSGMIGMGTPRILIGITIIIGHTTIPTVYGDIIMTIGATTCLILRTSIGLTLRLEREAMREIVVPLTDTERPAEEVEVQRLELIIQPEKELGIPD